MRACGFGLLGRALGHPEAVFYGTGLVHGDHFNTTDPSMWVSDLRARKSNLTTIDNFIRCPEGSSPSPTGHLGIQHHVPATLGQGAC